MPFSLRRWWPPLAAVVASAVVATLLATCPSTPHPRAGAPNILIIVTDDQRAGTLEVMPQTRRWFEQGGVSFADAFVTTPLCCPSRASILTGRYAHNHGIRVRVHAGSGVTKADSPFQRSTVERYLQDAGYRTAIFGKYLNGWPTATDPPYFDDWAIIRVPPSANYYGGEVNAQGTLEPMHTYNTTYIQDQALAFLKGTAHEGRPWFMYVAVKAPHSPYTAEPRYRTATVPPMTIDPAMTESNRGDKPPIVRAHRGTIADAERIRTAQLRTLMSVDDMVGALMREVDRLGQDRQTLAIFTSDNGYLWGEHGLVAQKLYPYTPAVTVPLLLRWPGHVKSGTTDHRLAANIDITPTILAATGVRPDLEFPLDGRSLLAPSSRRRLLLEYFAGIGKVPSWGSIRTATFQYVEYDDPGGAVTFREYYDLTRDPFELDNLLQDGNRGDDPNVAALSAQLARDRRCTGTGCP